MKPLISKCLAVGIILLFIGIAYAPAMAQNTEKQSVSRGTWLYVGGSGPGNYTRIQDAINDSTEGDTVFVYDDSSPYYENLIIQKSITLMGEDKNTTIIDGRNGANVTYVDCSNVTIRGFTIQHVIEPSKIFWVGIWIRGDDCSIEGNIIQENEEGIMFTNGPYHSLNPKGHAIRNNIIRNNHDGGIIAVIGALNFTISGNIIKENGNFGIILSNNVTSGNQIFHNIITDNNRFGVVIDGTLNNITENTIQNHVHGKYRGTGISIQGVYGSNDNRITRNNLINNTIQGMQKKSGNLVDIFTLLKLNNVWDENYWGESLSEPVQIPGLFIGRWVIQRGPIKGMSFNIFLFPWPAYDAHPAQEPYDIGDT